MESGTEREAWQGQGSGPLTVMGPSLVTKAPLLLKFLPRGRCNQHLSLLLRSQRFHQSSLWGTSEFIGLAHKA